jgi:translation initiation factor IF-1
LLVGAWLVRHVRTSVSLQLSDFIEVAPPYPIWHTHCYVARKDDLLSKDDLIDMQGTVVAVHSGGLYRVECDAGHEVLAQLSGRMRRFRIKVVPGDRVTVGVSPYDPVRGIITFRAR